jgi:dipeptidase E
MKQSNLLLLSSSKYRDTEYLQHAKSMFEGFLSGRAKELLFIPYANVAKEYDQYETRVGAALASLGVKVRSIHRAGDAAAAIKSAKAIAVGGGNTFALLSHLQGASLLDPIRQAVANGAPYIGWSAGANLACPTLCTTNDMPICEPTGFGAMGLIPFQLNAHYIAGKIAGHNGESRGQRLSEFLALNPKKCVLALPEGAALICRGGKKTISGEADGILFTSQGQKTAKRGEDLSWIWTQGQ